MREQPRPDQNGLLASLPPDVYQRIAPSLQSVPLFLGAMLYEPGAPLKAAYFPTSATISLHYVTITGASVETATVGREGMLGVTVLLGGHSTPSSAVVVMSGHAYRLDAKVLMQEFPRDAALRPMLLRYSQGLLTQMSQNAVCHRHHSVEQQLCRWLLQMIDRNPSRQLTMTQELLASILGIRRESVTEVAGRLQSSGCVSYRRGHIEVIDRAALEKRTCECYGVLHKELARLQPKEQFARAALQPA